MKEREKSRDKDKEWEGRMVRCLEKEQRIKEIIFSYSEDRLMFICLYLEIIAHDSVV